MRTVGGYRSKEAGTYIGPQYDPQVELQGLSVLFKYLLFPSGRHFSLGLRTDDEMLSEPFLPSPPVWLAREFHLNLRQVHTVLKPSSILGMPTSPPVHPA